MRGHGEMLAVRGESTPDCVMAWNTQRLQRALNAKVSARRSGIPSTPCEA
jgi:hypothetical protein